MVFALAGNQNCGKTTLFNRLTGSNQHVGNFPGVTTAPVAYNQQVEIRQLLIDWAVERGTIDPADFYVPNWTLTVDGVPVP